jgi:nucleoside transporter
MTVTTRFRMSAMMFAQYFIWGAWFVTLGTYMSKGLKFDDIIGSTYGTQGIAALLAPIFVGVIADRLVSAQKVLGILHFLGAGFMVWASTITQDKGLFFTAILGYFLCYMPTLPLANAVAFNVLEDTQKQFPAIRACGTLGWIVAGLGIGSLAGAAQTNLPMQIAAGASLVMGLYAFTLPDTPPRAKGTQMSLAGVFGLDLIAGIKDRSFWVFIFCSFLVVIPLSFYYAYANTFLVDAKAQVSAFGTIFEPAAIQTLGQASEFICILLLPLFLKNLGIRWVMIVGMAAWAARYLAFAFGIGDASPVMSLLLLGIILHGVCYDFFFVAGQIYVDTVFDKSRRARAQSFLAMVTLGIGQIIGSNLAGAIYDHYVQPAGGHDWKMIWLVPAALSAVVLVIFLITFKRPKIVTLTSA